MVCVLYGDFLLLLSLLSYSDFTQPQTYAEIQQTRNNT